MITTAQALAVAFVAAVHHFGSPFIGSAVVTARESQYLIALRAAEGPNVRLRGSAMAFVVIDKVSGSIVSIREDAPDKRTFEEIPTVTSAGQLHAAEAYEKAFASLQGYDRYDKFGGISLILRDSHYEVTFPPLSATADSIGDEFAYKVWIDAKSGATVKILVPS